MEVALIIILVLIMFAASIRGLARQVIEEAKNNPLGLLRYLGASSTFVLTCSFLPKILIDLYMRRWGFWAYEVFGSDSDAFDTLGLNVLLNYILLSVYMFSSAVVFLSDADREAKILVGLINLGAVGLVVMLAIHSGAWGLAGAVFVVCLLIALYAVFVAKVSVKKKAGAWWWIPLLASGVVLLLVCIFPGPASDLAEASLRQMKVGGIDVKLCEPNQLDARETCVSARLLLRTPEKIYVTFPHDAGDPKVFVATAEHYVVSYNR